MPRAHPVRLVAPARPLRCLAPSRRRQKTPARTIPSAPRFPGGRAGAAQMGPRLKDFTWKREQGLPRHRAGKYWIYLPPRLRCAAQEYPTDSSSFGRRRRGRRTPGSFPARAAGCSDQPDRQEGQFPGDGSGLFINPGKTCPPVATGARRTRSHAQLRVRHPRTTPTPRFP